MEVEITLKPCPCGKIPTELSIDQSGTKWAWTSGNCCGDWSLEFRAGYHTDLDELKKLAAARWNGAERGLPKVEESDGPDVPMQF